VSVKRASIIPCYCQHKMFLHLAFESVAHSAMPTRTAPLLRCTRSGELVATVSGVLTVGFFPR
jgi:hypothetical protein